MTHQAGLARLVCIPPSRLTHVILRPIFLKVARLFSLRDHPIRGGKTVVDSKEDFSLSSTERGGAEAEAGRNTEEVLDDIDISNP